MAPALLTRFWLVLVGWFEIKYSSSHKITICHADIAVCDSIEAIKTIDHSVKAVALLYVRPCVGHVPTTNLCRIGYHFS